MPEKEKYNRNKKLEEDKADLGRQRKQEFGELRGKAIYDRKARRELEQREKEADLAEKIEMRKLKPGWNPDYFIREEKTRKRNKKGGLFPKIPPEIILSPAGLMILLIAGIIEIIGVLVPIPVISTLIQLPFQVIFFILLIVIAKVPIKSLITPYIIDFIFPFLPTWLISILFNLLA